MAGGETFDKVFAPATVEATDVVDGVVLAAVRVDEDEDDAKTPVYGAIGVGGRPLDVDDPTGGAETICARLSDGLAVMCGRDLRIEQGRATPPAKGTIYLAGYYGAEMRVDVVSGQQRSTVTITDNAGRELVLDDQGVRVPTSPLIQGNPLAAQDVPLAGPLILAFTALDAALQALALIPALSAASAALGAAHTALAPYLVPGSPTAPTTRAPDLRGAPGA